MKMRKGWIFGFAAIVILFPIAIIGFLKAGIWLVVSDPVPQDLDVVFTFASERARVEYSRQLINRFPNAHWVLSDSRNGYVRILRKNGFDMSKVTPIDTCSNTFAELNALRAWIRNDTIHTITASFNSQKGKQDGLLRVGLVSSPYHMRRIKMMTLRKFRKINNIEFYYLPVPLEQYSWNKQMLARWWENRIIRNVVFLELQKIVYFLITN